MTSSILGISDNQKIELPKSSRLQGLYVIGATGTGKSGLLENLIIQDIHQNIGCAVLDPHGDLIDKILSRIKAEDEDKIIYLDVLNRNYSFGLNLYNCSDPSDPERVVRTFEQVEHLFELLWGRDIEIATRPDLSQAIRNTAYSFIYNSDTEYTGCGLVELPLLYEEEIPRSNIIRVLPKRSDRLFSYWNRFNSLSDVRQREFSQMLVSRSERFIMNEFIRTIVGQSKTTINFREVMDQGKILLVKLPGQFEDMTELLGSMIIAEILSAALSRSDTQKRRQFNIYADEFQKFASSDFSKLLTECRKYGQAVTIAHQARDFIDLKNKAASLQAANIAVFRVIPKDAHEIAGLFDCSPPVPDMRPIEKLEPIRDVVSHLVRVGHPHPTVDAFVKDILIPIYESTDTIVSSVMSSYKLQIILRGKTTFYIIQMNRERLLYMLNNFFYEVMVTKNPRQTMPIRLFHTLVRIDSEVYDFPMIFKMVEKELVFYDGKITPLLVWQESELKKLFDSFWLDPKLNDLRPASLNESTIYKQILTIFVNKYLDEHTPPDLFDRIMKQFATEEEQHKEYVKETDKIDFDPLWKEVNYFGQFLGTILIVMNELAREPITSGAGIYDMLPLHEMTYADVANQIANQLSRLEKHTARVRIHGVSDTLEEYLIETEKPGNGINEKALEERKQRILASMISQNIYRSKVEIDEEIRNRHVKLRTASQKPVVQKPTELTQKKQEIQQPKRLRRVESDIEETQPAQPVPTYAEMKKQELLLFGERLYNRYLATFNSSSSERLLNYNEWQVQELEKARELDG